MAKRSFKTLEGIEEDDSETEQEETESEDEEERTEERRVMIRVVPRERFERTDLIHSGSASCTTAAAAAAAANLLCCQADECSSNLRNAKQYHRRHKVCELHAKAPFVLVKGIRQRFCQQCSRFHEVSAFDGTKRSCRHRLAGHNERRRKAQSEQQAENVKRSPTSKMKDERHPKHRELTLQGCTNTKHFRII